MTTDMEQDFILTEDDQAADLTLLRAQVTQLDRELRAEVDRLTTELTHQRELAETLRTRRDEVERDLHAERDAHRGDIALIGSVLMDEANDREWCDDYDRVIERLNDRLTVQLPVREKQHSVSVTVTYSYEVLVLASDQEEAEEMIGTLMMPTHWTPGLPISDDRVELDSSYAYNVGVEVV